jgi:hypothetical protein
MQHCRARSIVFVVDCCHSGAFAKGLVPKSAPSSRSGSSHCGQSRDRLDFGRSRSAAPEAARRSTQRLSD